MCHPRQAARLGHSSKTWGELHDGWVKRKNEIQLYELKYLSNFGYLTLLISLCLFGALFYWRDWFSIDIRWNQIVRVSIWAAATTLLYNGLDLIIAFKKKKNPNRFWRFVYKWVHNKTEN